MPSQNPQVYAMNAAREIAQLGSVLEAQGVDSEDLEIVRDLAQELVGLAGHVESLSGSAKGRSKQSLSDALADMSTPAQR
jgi:hypothetical protein